MADVPDQPVVGRVEHVVQRHGQFDHAEAGAEMAAGDRHRIDCFRAQLVRHLRELARLHAAQVGGVFDAVEDWT